MLFSIVSMSFTVCIDALHADPLADTNISGKDQLQESEALTPGNDLMTFDTGVCSILSDPLSIADEAYI